MSFSQLAVKNERKLTKRSLKRLKELENNLHNYRNLEENYTKFKVELEKNYEDIVNDVKVRRKFY